jgi:hypothetical protein
VKIKAKDSKINVNKLKFREGEWGVWNKVKENEKVQKKKYEKSWKKLKEQKKTEIQVKDIKNQIKKSQNGRKKKDW